MSEFDPRTQRAIEQLRKQWSPPPGHEDAMLSSFRARLDGPPGDGGGHDGPFQPAGDGVAKVVYAMKVVGAVAGLTAAGVGALWLVASLVRGATSPPRERAPDSVELTTTSEPVASELEPPTPQPEPAPSPTTSTANAVEHEPKPVDARRSRPSRSSKPEGDPGPSLAAELALIREARDASPSDALVLLERHAEEFPQGTLASERDALRAAALCRLDRLSEAAEIVEGFAAANPSALLRERVRSACANKIELPTTAFDRAGDGSG